MRVLSSRALRLLLFAGAILASAAGVSYATGLATRAAPAAVINGCFKTMSGDLRVIDPSTESCLPSETAISWNQTGPAGQPGPKGDPGAVSSLDALNGIPCSLAGRTGQTMVSTSGPFTGASLQFIEQIQCVTADAREPNDTRATETTVSGFAYLTLYPAGDEDWFVIGGTPFTITASQLKTGADSVFNAPIHIDLRGRRARRQRRQYRDVLPVPRSYVRGPRERSGAGSLPAAGVLATDGVRVSGSFVRRPPADVAVAMAWERSVGNRDLISWERYGRCPRLTVRLTRARGARTVPRCGLWL